MSDVMQWRRRRTARWMALSLAARGAVEGIVAASDEAGVLRLPPEGLPSLAHLLGRPWTEVEPAIAEVLLVGKLVHDAERNVITDPSRSVELDEDEGAMGVLRRQLAELRDQLVAAKRPPTAAAAAMAAVAAPRPLSMTQNAIRKRAQRAAKVVSSRGTQPDPRQLDLLAATAPAAAAMAATPSLSDLSSSKKKEEERRVSLAAAAAMPAGWLESAQALRADLVVEVIERSWRRFTLAKAGSFASWSIVQSRWESWLERERVPAPPREAIAAQEPPPASTPWSSPRPDVKPAPYHFEAKLAVPDEEPEVPTPPRRPLPRPAVDDDYRASAARLASLSFCRPPPSPRSMSA